MAEVIGEYWISPFLGGAQMQAWTWIFATILITSFLQGASMGANDVGNMYGTSVGSKVLTMTQACILATIFVTLGALAIGQNVAKTIGKGIVNYALFKDYPQLFMLGMLMASIGAGVWVWIATYLKLPVSTTHSIVGAVIGFGLVEFGGDGIDWWPGLGQIVISWVASPIFTGIFGVIFYLAAKYWFLRPLQKRGEEWLERALFHQMLYMGCALFIVVLTFVIFTTFTIQKKEVGMNLGISFGCATAVALIWVLGGNKLFDRYFEKRGLVGGFETTVSDEKDVEKAVDRNAARDSSSSDPESQEQVVGDKTGDEQTAEQTAEQTKAHDAAKEVSQLSVVSSVVKTVDELDDGLPPNDVWHPVIEKRFAFGQLVSACYEAIAFGANDIGNAAGTLQAVYQTLEHVSVVGKPKPVYWALAYCCVGILLGLWIYGYNVMHLIGEDLAFMTPARGQAIELATGFAVLIASFIGIPVSTTHCVIGAVIAVGICEPAGLRKVRWRMVLKIFASWIVTVPAAMGVSAGLYAAARASTKYQWFVPPAYVVSDGNFNYNDYSYTCTGTALAQNCVVQWVPTPAPQ